MDELDKFLIIGLGNPGSAYKNTRHNVGFRIVQSFADQHAMTFKKADYLSGNLAQGIVSDKKILALLPTTYMNSSGQAVKLCIDYFKVPVESLIVVCDDVALPFAKLRLRSQGTSGGHNGLKSIESHLNTQYYARLKIGVGAPEAEVLSDYVLGQFPQNESALIEAVVKKAIEVLDVWIGSGIAAAMQCANNASKDFIKEEGEKNV